MNTDVEVINCRASRRYCYVWVKETMEQTENGTVNIISAEAARRN